MISRTLRIEVHIWQKTKSEKNTYVNPKFNRFLQPAGLIWSYGLTAYTGIAENVFNPIYSKTSQTQNNKSSPSCPWQTISGNLFELWLQIDYTLVPPTLFPLLRSVPQAPLAKLDIPKQPEAPHGTHTGIQQFSGLFHPFFLVPIFFLIPFVTSGCLLNIWSSTITWLSQDGSRVNCADGNDDDKYGGRWRSLFQLCMTEFFLFLFSPCSPSRDTGEYFIASARWLRKSDWIKNGGVRFVPSCLFGGRKGCYGGSGKGIEEIDGNLIVPVKWTLFRYSVSHVLVSAPLLSSSSRQGWGYVFRSARVTGGVLRCCGHECVFFFLPFGRM